MQWSCRVVLLVFGFLDTLFELAAADFLATTTTTTATRSRSNNTRHGAVDATLQGIIRGLTNRTTKTGCNKNTFIIDWGSTGAKLFLAHKALHPDQPAEFARDLSDKVVIEDWLKPEATQANIDDLIETMKGELSQDGPYVAALATGGNRLKRQRTRATWKLLRARNAANKIFQDCDQISNLGCRTLSGADEAMYEFNIARGSDTSTGQMGMISAGGASLQVSFEVPADRVDEAADCAKQLNRTTTDSGSKTKYVEKAAEYREDSRLLTLSWLSVRQEGDKTNLFAVGGVNEMRAAFDMYLLDQAGKTIGNMGNTTNPCLKGAWSTTGYNESKDTDGSKTTVANTQYLEDERHSFITMLPGASSPTTAGCLSALKAFVGQDFMVEKFAESSCKALSKNVDDWKLITSFYHAFDGKHPMTQWTNKTGIGFKHGFDAYKATNPLTNAGADKYAEFYNRAMLDQVMEALGVLDESDIVDVQHPAEWIVAAGQSLPTPLAPGWLTDAECIAAEGTSR